MFQKKQAGTIHIYPQQIVRTPFFTINEDLNKNWDILKGLIKEASPAFYERIINLQAHETDYQFDKVSFSIWKYFNRSKFRAVPFGRFAAISLIFKETIDNDGSIVVNEHIQNHVFIDWDEQEKHNNKISREVIDKARWFITNSTLYTAGDWYRYVDKEGDRFEINQIGKFEELNSVLEFCLIKQEKQNLLKMLNSKFQLSNRSINSLLTQLLNNQLIWTDQTCNITGQDYFHRIGCSQHLSPENHYTIAERKCIQGGIDNKELKLIPELIEFLNKHLPFQENTQLDNFTKAFSNKFDRAVIPLSAALDPELGVGYANLEYQEDSIGLGTLKRVFENDNEFLPRQLYMSPLLIYILNNSSNGKTVQLENFEGTDRTYSQKLPNTFSILYHLWNGIPIIHNIGGCTANSLIGRFTMASNEIEMLGKRIAEIEKEANPEVVFFDVSYQGEKHVDNINRRTHLYDTELPLFTWSTMEEPLNLQDIYVSVIGSEIFLYSKKSGKRLIPRIPTAYNYSRSDLAVYRFLSDLQHHHLRSDLSLSISKYVPGQNYYSRIAYKQIILSPASWLVPCDLITKITKENIHDGIKTVKNWLLIQKIDFPFQSGRGDQMLTFNPNIENDVTAFVFYCRQQSHNIYISEALLSSETGIKNANGNNYFGQFHAICHHSNELYQNPLKNLNVLLEQQTESERKKAPGSDWIYFEIYCHPIRSNKILSEKIEPFLRREHHKLRKWFFIRYNEKGYHLRLRLHLKKVEYYGELIQNMFLLLAEDITNGFISDLQIRTYVRELERYSIFGMEQIENLFWVDSKAVIAILKRDMKMESLYSFTLNFMKLLVSQTFADPINRYEFIKTMCTKFNQEFSLNTASFKLINKNYEILMKHKNDAKLFNTNTLKVAKLLIAILDNCNNMDEKGLLLANLLHMHINRLFLSESRKHEAILYHYLLKDMKKSRSASLMPKE